jgi:hypothetical protein
MRKFANHVTAERYLWHFATQVCTPFQINHLSQMMSATISFEDARKALAEDGFYCIQDPTVGLRILEMERNGSQFSPSSEAGLEFCKFNVLKDAVGQSWNPIVATC